MKPTLRSTIVLASVALAALAACKGPGPRTVILTVTALYEDGVLTISEEPHETTALSPGDQLVWKCACPEGVRFAVHNVRHLANLDDVADLYHALSAEGGVEAVRDALWGGMPVAAQEAEAAEAEDAEVAAARAAEMMRRRDLLFERLAQPTRESPGRPFDREVSDDFAERDGSIESGPLRRMPGNHLWKFDWVVRDAEGATDVWDPHFSSHSDPRGPKG